MRKYRSNTAAAALTWLLLTSATSLAAQSPNQFAFDLPAEALSQALRDVAVKTGRSVIAPADLVGSRQAPPLSGKFTAEEAISRLLAGTGLQHRDVDGALVIEPAPFANAEDGESGQGSHAAVTVTGSRIRGVGSASPVNVTSRRELEQAGISDLADFTRILPQNYTGGQNRGIAGGGEQGGQQNLNNSVALNLRGLGPDATLTLLNGHRLAYDALDQGVDISAIPLSAIERIEVVADGASALYGSDAVGGVANIILRRDFQGLDTTARIAASTSGGNLQRQVSLVTGRVWNAGGFMLAMDHSRATEIDAGDRDYAGSLDPSFFLTDRIRQTSGVLAGHQELNSTLRLELDGVALDRRSLSQNPFFATADARVSGIVARGHVRSWALAPTLHGDLGPWRASLGVTAARSRTFLDANNAFNSVVSRAELLYANRLRGIEASGEGPLFTLPGGAARLALGAGARGISLHVRQDVTRAGRTTTTSDFLEKRSGHYIYGELSIPFVQPDLELPFLHRLTLSAAVRYEHWNKIASVSTPKLGVVYQPSRDLTFRATWGKSFKIPTLLQVNQIPEGILLPGFIFTPAPQPVGSPVLLLSGSAPNLKPERATSWSATLEAHPRSMPGLNIRTTYFDIDYRDRIAAPITSVLTAISNPVYSDLIRYNPSADEVNALIATLPGALVNQTGEPFDAGSVGAIIDSAIRNTERQRIRGVDADIRYHADLGGHGALILSAAASYLTSKQRLAPGQPDVPLAGTIFNPPRWRGRAGATWDAGPYGVSAFINYVGLLKDERTSVTERIKPFVTLDLSASVRTKASGGLSGNVELRLSAVNLLNQQPRRITTGSLGGAPYDSTNHSPLGRVLAASLRKVW